VIQEQRRNISYIGPDVENHLEGTLIGQLLEVIKKIDSPSQFGIYNPIFTDPFKAREWEFHLES
jgi:hypothetical protein